MKKSGPLKPLPVLNHRCKLGEGPLWDPSGQFIYWIDILNAEIHRYSPSSGIHKIIPVPEMPGTIALTKSGLLLAALQSGLVTVNPVSGEVKTLLPRKDGKENSRYNDGKCDPEGRLWVGTMDMEEKEEAGTLFRIDKDLSVHAMIENCTISNGIAWTDDFKRFYFIDSPTRKITAYDFNVETGGISNPRVAVSIPEEEGFPDGMTIDTEGMLWVAHFGGSQVARWNPDTGEKLLSVPLPVSQVTCCCFGGPSLSDLYISTAFKELSQEQREKEPLAGSLFVLRDSGFRGFDSFRFATAD